MADPKEEIDPSLLKDLTGLVNASGFQFQLAVQQLIAATGKWKVLLTEYPWTHPISNVPGFVDAVSEDSDGVVRLVVECKRVRDGSWVFLNPSISASVDTLWTAAPPYRMVSGVSELSFRPETAQSEFCAVRGTGEQQRPMLERIAANVLNAAEAVSRDQLNIDASQPSRSGRYWMYVPLIVTNARLYTCSFKPSEIDATTGDIPANTVFEEVGCVRFSKTLSTNPQLGDVQSLQEVAQARRRTAIVVNVAALQEFLMALTVTGSLPAEVKKAMGWG